MNNSLMDTNSKLGVISSTPLILPVITPISISIPKNPKSESPIFKPLGDISQHEKEKKEHERKSNESLERYRHETEVFYDTGVYKISRIKNDY